MFSTLTAGKSGTSCATETFNASFERSDQCMEQEAQGRGKTSTLSHALLKKAILHHTEAKGV